MKERAKTIFDFPSEEAQIQFLDWLYNMGEQLYWNDIQMRCEKVECEDFEYKDGLIIIDGSR